LSATAFGEADMGQPATFSSVVPLSMPEDSSEHIRKIKAHYRSGKSSLAADF
jgi:hypothetical protein